MKYKEGSFVVWINKDERIIDVGYIVKVLKKERVYHIRFATDPEARYREWTRELFDYYEKQGHILVLEKSNTKKDK